MNSKIYILAFTVSAMVHAGIIFSFPETSPVEVQYKYGYSAVNMTIIPSSPAVSRTEDSPSLLKELDKNLTEPYIQRKESLFTEQAGFAEIPIPEQEDAEKVDRREETEKTPEALESEIERDRAEPEDEDADSFDAPDSPGDKKEEGIESGIKKKHAPHPEYPRLARRRGYEGVVTVEVEVNKHGEAMKAEVVSSSGYESLDDAAVEAAKKARFLPAQVAGVGVSSTIRIKYKFLLKNAWQQKGNIN